jgi:hypothetical protein
MCTRNNASIQPLAGLNIDDAQATNGEPTLPSTIAPGSR